MDVIIHHSVTKLSAWALGRLVETQVKTLVKNLNLGVEVHFLVHPSPASPVANAGWDCIALKMFTTLGLLCEAVPTLNDGDKKPREDCAISNEQSEQPQNVSDKIS